MFVLEAFKSLLEFFELGAVLTNPSNFYSAMFPFAKGLD